MAKEEEEEKKEEKKKFAAVAYARKFNDLWQFMAKEFDESLPLSLMLLYEGVTVLEYTELYFGK